MRGWEETPAVVVSRRLDVLAKNPLATAIYDGLDHNDNLMRLTFLNPEGREFYPDWEHEALSKTAQLRAAVGANLDDPAFLELVEELSQGSAEFRRMWARHDVRAKTNDSIRFRHRVVGDLTLSYQAFTINSAPGQELFAFQAEPGSPSEHALSLLRSLASVCGCG
jgi:hypothetical protein